MTDKELYIRNLKIDIKIFEDRILNQVKRKGYNQSLNYNYTLGVLDGLKRSLLIIKFAIE